MTSRREKLYNLVCKCSEYLDDLKQQIEEEKTMLLRAHEDVIKELEAYNAKSASKLNRGTTIFKVTI